MAAIDLRGLVDGDVRLRAPVPGDVPAITATCQDPDVQRHTRVPTPYTEESARSFVLMAIGALAEARGAHLLAVPAAAPTAEVWGCIGVQTASDGSAQLGYWVTPGARGRKVATRGARLLAELAFAQLRVATLVVHVSVTNPASAAVARAVGFRHAGTLRAAHLDGPSGDPATPRVDLDLYDLLPGELTSPVNRP